MTKLLMITGLGSAKNLASGRRGAFYNTLEEFHKYWDRIDIISPRITNHEPRIMNLFGNVFVHISPWPLMFHPFWFLKKGLEIYKEQKFDLMTVHEFPPFYNGIGARLLWQKIKVPYLLEILHIPGYPRAASPKELIYKILFKLFIKIDASKAKMVRVMNEGVLDFLVKHGIPREKIVRIPAIYLDLDIFKPMNLPKEYDLIFVGRLEKNKGIDLFLETVKKLDASAVIVGDGSLAKDIKLKIKNWGLKIDGPSWANDSSEVSEYMNKSKTLIMPSYNEGGPRVVVEAMACGVPVLATQVGIAPDLLKNGLGGDIIDWRPDDIAQKAADLLNNQDKYQKYSQSGQEIAKQFEKTAAIKNYAEKLKELI